MKRIAMLILCITLLAGCLAGCGEAPASSGKLQVVATLFPQYDFARRVAGDRAAVTMLLPPGVESHSFDPTPADLVTMQKADLFQYTGAQMETWAGSLLSSLPREHDGRRPLSGHRTVGGSARRGLGRSQPSGRPPHLDQPQKRHDYGEASIRDALCSADPDGAAIYEENANQYLEELAELDAAFRDIVANGIRRTLAFSGRFALHSFAEEYGLDCVAALESCSGESEPSAQSVARVISVIREQGLPVVYYEELSDPKVGRSIASETGVQLLLFHSCHNLSKDEFDRGETYLSLMRQNAENLKVGLNG